jgi:putative ABC transport system permease protein
MVAVVALALRPALIGTALGITGALGLTRLMSSALYGDVALDPTAFAGVALLLAVSALVAAYVPAHRASAIDPVCALREE